jgi:hypothetical protein
LLLHQKKPWLVVELLLVNIPLFLLQRGKILNIVILIDDKKNTMFLLLFPKAN